MEERESLCEYLFFFNLSKTLVSEYCSYFLSLPLPESVNEGISPKAFLTFVEKILFHSTMEQFFSQHLNKIGKFYFMAFLINIIC